MLVNKSFMTPLSSPLNSAAIGKFHIGGASASDLPFNPGPVQSGWQHRLISAFPRKKIF